MKTTMTKRCVHCGEPCLQRNVPKKEPRCKRCSEIRSELYQKVYAMGYDTAMRKVAKQLQLSKREARRFANLRGTLQKLAKDIAERREIDLEKIEHLGRGDPVALLMAAYRELIKLPIKFKEPRAAPADEEENKDAN